jgi:hypothetical protein
MNMTNDRQSQQADFEDEVRRIARYLWPSAQFSGQAIEDNQERDGVFITDNQINLVEATHSKTKDKARKDIRKLVDLAQKKRHSHPTHAIN